MNKINIMHLRSCFGSGGGPEKTILLSAEKINKERFNMITVYLKGEDDLNFSITEKAQAEGLNFHTVSERHRIDTKAIKTILGLLKKYQIDILHCHGYKSNVLGLLLSKWYRVKLVTTAHGWIGNGPKERFYNWLDKNAIKYYDRIITVCDQMHHYLLKMGLPSHKLMTIHNAIDTDDFGLEGRLQDLRPELNLDKDAWVIGIIGRLSREKRIETFFSIAKKTILEGENIKFLIAGDGPLTEGLKFKVKSLNLEDAVFFLGQRDDIKRVYKTIDLLVSLSRTEGLSNVILEALACGVPVVATKVGGNSEIIRDRVNGLLFSPEDIDGITKGILSLLLNRKMALDFSREGRKLIREKFSFDERMRKIEKVYLEIVGKEL